MLKLRHPHVVMTIGFATDNETQHAMVMEAMQCSLKALLDSTTPLPWAPTLWRVAADMAAGMTYLHDRAVLHRDLKPANVLLGPPPRYVAKLSDFGESRQLKGADGALQQTTGEMTMVGTPSLTLPSLIPIPIPIPIPTLSLTPSEP